MQCPVCKSYEHSDIHFRAGQFNEDLIKCPTCDSSWSVNHGLTEIVKDTQERSFLSATSECVEGYDYALAA
ncbi:MAG TPA: hypothetical protein HPP76_03830 [Desulfuromonadales bacterium]|nr:hypothetical protein [Desulfuromonadales bacterium]